MTDDKTDMCRVIMQPYIKMWANPFTYGKSIAACVHLHACL